MRIAISTMLVLVGLVEVGHPAGLPPFQGDETRIEDLKLNPQAVFGKELTLYGGIKVSNSYQGAYSFAERFYYSYEFREVQKKARIGGPSFYLYLKRDIGAEVAGRMAAHHQEKPDDFKIARLKVAYKRFDKKNWKTLEVLDVQFLKADESGWEEPMIGDRAAATQETEAKGSVVEHAQFRQWVRVKGTFPPQAKKGASAKLLQVEGDEVLLELKQRPGKPYRVKLSDLSKNDQAYVAETKKAQKK